MPNKRTRVPPLSNFIAKFKQESISRQNRYFAEFSLPKIMVSPMQPADMELINLYVEQTMFPEFAVATQTTLATSLHVEMPYDKMFGSISMTFLCDRDMKIKSYFDAWAMGLLNCVGGVFNYYDDYVVPELNIYQYDEDLDVVYCVTLYNAYPKVVNDMILSSASTDLNRFQVVFAYEQWKSWQVGDFKDATRRLNTSEPRGAFSKGGLAEKLLGSGSGDFLANFDKIPGIDMLTSVTGISNGLDLINKMKNPALFRDSLKRSSKSLGYEALKPMKQKILEGLPKSVRQIGGSGMSQTLGKFGL